MHLNSTNKQLDIKLRPQSKGPLLINKIEWHHLRILTHMNKVADRTMGEQRLSLITEAIQAFEMHDESAAQQ